MADERKVPFLIIVPAGITVFHYSYQILGSPSIHVFFLDDSISLHHTLDIIEGVFILSTQNACCQTSLQLADPTYLQLVGVGVDFVLPLEEEGRKEGRRRRTLTKALAEGVTLYA